MSSLQLDSTLQKHNRQLNLFLERIITFLAYILRAIHDRKLKAKGDSSDESKSRRNSDMLFCQTTYEGVNGILLRMNGKLTIGKVKSLRLW
jgi:hypothetical protein